MDVFEFAMKMEMDGKAYYERLAAETTIEGFATIFRQLAADEQKHYDTIRAIREGAPQAMAETTVLADARNVFQQAMQDQTLLEGMKEDLEAYEYAKKIEADSVRLYEDMAAKEQNEQLVNLFLRLAGEEKKHFNIMENVYDFVLRPKYYLEWREFSNLGQL